MCLRQSALKSYERKKLEANKYFGSKRQNNGIYFKSQADGRSSWKPRGKNLNGNFTRIVTEAS